MHDLSSLVVRAAQWFAGSVAVSEQSRSLTFADVDSRSNRLAHALLDFAKEPHARVAVLAPNRIELVESDIAIIKAGLVRVPINVRLSNDERTFLLNDSGAAILIFDSGEEEAVAEILTDVDRDVVALRLGPGQLGRCYDETIAASSADRTNVNAGASDPSLILYTSGTTGRPKGATTTRTARLQGTANMLSSEIDPRPGDAMAHVGSMAHGSGSKMLAHFIRGSRNIAVSHWDPASFLRLIETERVTHSFLVPTMINMLVDQAIETRTDWSSISAITYGGAPIAPTRLQAAIDTFGPRFVQVYGSCEAPHPVLVLGTDDHVHGGTRLSSAGREALGYETRIVTNDGLPVERGEPGELLVRGPSLMTGYWDRPLATDEVLQDGWYSTGDVVRRDDEGYVHIVDRARDVIISGGYNVYPAELEAVLAAHGAVAEVAVIGVPDDHWGESVKALVVAPALRGSSDGEQVLIDHCKPMVAGYKRPRSIEFVESLPKGSTGKILRRQLRDKYWEERERLV